MKERLQKNDIIDAMKDGGTRKINFDYFSQMFFSLQNLNLVYQSCHDRDKKCPCTCRCKSRECNRVLVCICNCPSVDESKVFIPEKKTLHSIKKRLNLKWVNKKEINNYAVPKVIDNYLKCHG